MNADGSHLNRITNDKKDNIASFGPAGRLRKALVFASIGTIPNAQIEVYKINLNGTGLGTHHLRGPVRRLS